MLDAPIKVLLVEDSDLDARLAVDNVQLADAEGLFTFERARTLSEALELVDSTSFDCILLDLNLPDGSGVENVETLASAAAGVAIVVMTGLQDEATAIAALKLGAQEYVAKDKYDGESLVRIMRHAMQRNSLLREINAQRDQEYLAASHDPLTGLANRKLFEDIAQRAQAVAQRKGTDMALCFVDLDGFKPVNDRHGHAAGDNLLVRIAQEMQLTVRDADTVARVGGDEFAVLITEFATGEDTRQQAESVASRIVDRITGITQMDGHAISVGASVGVAMYPAHGSELSQLLVNADMAMYAAKRDGGDQVRMYSSNLRGQPGSGVPPTARVDQALAAGEFLPHYQPVMDVRSGQITGVEALLRWQAGDELRTPVRFLSDIERSGQVVAVGRQMRDIALRDFSRWCATWPALATLALNLSASELAEPDPAGALAAQLASHGVAPARVQLEFPHMALGEHAQELMAFRAAGFVVVGALRAGQEVHLATLTQAPLDAVKLDRDFVRQLQLPDNDPERKLADAMLALVSALKLPLMAVGVETEEELAALRAHQCTHAQGHWLHPPMPGSAIEDILGG